MELKAEAKIQGAANLAGGAGRHMQAAAGIVVPLTQGFAAPPPKQTLVIHSCDVIPAKREG